MNLETLRFGNAAGTIKRLGEVERACMSAMTDITIGSITIKEQGGNTGDTYYFHPREKWSLNSLGLPNVGLEMYLRLLPDLRQRIHAAEKNMRVSVAGFSPKEYAILSEQCLESGADEIELNLGCPNVWGEEGQKPIPSYNPELTAQILEEVKRAVAPNQVAAKISPVDHWETLLALLDTIKKSEVVSKLVANNTIPNVDRPREDGKPALNFNNGNHLGGLAGSAILESTLRVVGTCVNRLGSSIKVDMAGGIFSGKEVERGYRLGATGFQCATAYLQEGPKIFSDILQELSEPA